MNYIIADPDLQTGIELRKMLDNYEGLEFQGSYATLGAAEQDCHNHPPDIAFIRLGKAELNSFRLAGTVRELNSSVKIVYVSCRKENAVEAFEYGADGFLLIPFNNKKIGKLLQQIIDTKNMKGYLK